MASDDAEHTSCLERGALCRVLICQHLHLAARRPEPEAHSQALHQLRARSSCDATALGMMRALPASTERGAQIPKQNLLLEARRSLFRGRQADPCGEVPPPLNPRMCRSFCPTSCNTTLWAGSLHRAPHSPGLMHWKPPQLCQIVGI